jgi:hypothetical protein
MRLIRHWAGSPVRSHWPAQHRYGIGIRPLQGRYFLKKIKRLIAMERLES